MLKNIRIGTKLVAVGTLIMLLPLVVVTYLAVARSDAGLTRLGLDEMATRADSIAKMIDRVIGEEKKVALAVANNPRRHCPRLSQSETGAWPGAGNALQRANDALAPYGSVSGVSDSYESVVLTGRDGIVIADSSSARRRQPGRSRLYRERARRKGHYRGGHGKPGNGQARSFRSLFPSCSRAMWSGYAPSSPR